jgi:hypothetical protein
MPPGGDLPAMTENTLHRPGDVADEPHGAADHGEEHGHDDHADAEEPLGPIDAPAWAALVGGIALGLLVAVAILISTSA